MIDPQDPQKPVQPATKPSPQSVPKGSLMDESPISAMAAQTDDPWTGGGSISKLAQEAPDPWLERSRPLTSLEWWKHAGIRAFRGFGDASINTVRAAATVADYAGQLAERAMGERSDSQVEWNPQVIPPFDTMDALAYLKGTGKQSAEEARALQSKRLGNSEVFPSTIGEFSAFVGPGPLSMLGKGASTMAKVAEEPLQNWLIKQITKGTITAKEMEAVVAGGNLAKEVAAKAGWSGMTNAAVWGGRHFPSLLPGYAGLLAQSYAAAPDEQKMNSLAHAALTTVPVLWLDKIGQTIGGKVAALTVGAERSAGLLEARAMAAAGKADPRTIGDRAITAMRALPGSSLSAAFRGEAFNLLDPEFLGDYYKWKAGDADAGSRFFWKLFATPGGVLVTGGLIPHDQVPYFRRAFPELNGLELYLEAAQREKLAKELQAQAPSEDPNAPAREFRDAMLQAHTERDAAGQNIPGEPAAQEQQIGQPVHPATILTTASRPLLRTGWMPEIDRAKFTGEEDSYTFRFGEHTFDVASPMDGEHLVVRVPADTYHMVRNEPMLVEQGQTTGRTRLLAGAEAKQFIQDASLMALTRRMQAELVLPRTGAEEGDVGQTWLTEKGRVTVGLDGSIIEIGVDGKRTKNGQHVNDIALDALSNPNYMEPGLEKWAQLVAEKTGAFPEGNVDRALVAAINLAIHGPDTPSVHELRDFFRMMPVTTAMLTPVGMRRVALEAGMLGSGLGNAPDSMQRVSEHLPNTEGLLLNEPPDTETPRAMADMEAEGGGQPQGPPTKPPPVDAGLDTYLGAPVDAKLAAQEANAAQPAQETPKKRSRKAEAPAASTAKEASDAAVEEARAERERVQAEIAAASAEKAKKASFQAKAGSVLVRQNWRKAEMPDREDAAREYSAYMKAAGEYVSAMKLIRLFGVSRRAAGKIEAETVFDGTEPPEPPPQKAEVPKVAKEKAALAKEKAAKIEDAHDTEDAISKQVEIIDKLTKEISLAGGNDPNRKIMEDTVAASRKRLEELRAKKGGKPLGIVAGGEGARTAGEAIRRGVALAIEDAPIELQRFGGDNGNLGRLVDRAFDLRRHFEGKVYREEAAARKAYRKVAKDLEVLVPNERGGSDSRLKLLVEGKIAPANNAETAAIDKIRTLTAKLWNLARDAGFVRQNKDGEYEQLPARDDGKVLVRFRGEDFAEVAGSDALLKRYGEIVGQRNPDLNVDKFMEQVRNDQTTKVDPHEKDAAFEYFRTIKDVPDAFEFGGKTYRMFDSSVGDYIKRLVSTQTARLASWEAFGADSSIPKAVREKFDLQGRGLHEEMSRYFRGTESAITPEYAQNLARDTVARLHHIEPKQLPNSPFMRAWRVMEGFRRAAQVSQAGAYDIFDFLAGVLPMAPGFAGALAKGGFVDGVLNLKETLRALHMLGAVAVDRGDYNFVEAKGLINIARDFLNLGNKGSELLKQSIAGGTAIHLTKQMMAGALKDSPVMRNTLEALHSFTPAEIDSMLSGNLKGELGDGSLFDTFVRKFTAFTTANRKPGEGSALSADPRVNFVFGFWRFFMARGNQFYRLSSQLASGMANAALSRTPESYKEAGAAFASWGKFVGGVTIAGSIGNLIGYMLRDVTDPSRGMERWWREITDAPRMTMLKAFGFQLIGGPLAVVAKGIAEDRQPELIATRAFTPLQPIVEGLQALTGYAQYAGMSPTEAMVTYALRFPTMPGAVTSAFLVGNSDIQVARRQFYDWQRAAGYRPAQDYPSPENEPFYYVNKDLDRAIQENAEPGPEGQAKLFESLRGPMEKALAIETGGDISKALKARRILPQMNATQREDFAQRYGREALDKLYLYDKTLDMVAEKYEKESGTEKARLPFLQRLRDAESQAAVYGASDVWKKLHGEVLQDAVTRITHGGISSLTDDWRDLADKMALHPTTLKDVVTPEQFVLLNRVNHPQAGQLMRAILLEDIVNGVRSKVSGDLRAQKEKALLELVR